jgi:demethylmenaquinone methyltransferase/2-methoxy-6-polyprenyl-1,4-benzoquinol methylase
MRKYRQKYYDLFSHVYDRFISMHSSGKQGYLKELLAQTADISPGDKVLDLCTGTGSLLFYLKQKTGKSGSVTGVDFSRGMLNVAARKISSLPNVFLVQADIAALPFKADTFDAVTCAHAFYELKDDAQRQCLFEIRQVLKIGKPFLMMEHDVPEKLFIRILFYIRLMSMGFKKAVYVLKHERQMLSRYFPKIQKVKPASGRSKIWVCYR